MGGERASLNLSPFKHELQQCVSFDPFDPALLRTFNSGAYQGTLSIPKDTAITAPNLDSM